MKRLVSATLAILFALSCCFGAVSAEGGIMPLASPTIMGQGANMRPGKVSGELRISYNINATSAADEVGVSMIELYKSDGSYVDTIYGTTSNGLVRTSAWKNMGTYSYTNAESGEFYFAIVTLYATIGSLSDSETVTTATVKAP